MKSQVSLLFSVLWNQTRINAPRCFNLYYVRWDSVHLKFCQLLNHHSFHTFVKRETMAMILIGSIICTFIQLPCPLGSHQYYWLWWCDQAAIVTPHLSLGCQLYQTIFHTFRRYWDNALCLRGFRGFFILTNHFTSLEF